MAKKSAKSKGYRRQQQQKPYLTKRDIVILCILVVAVIIGAIALFSYDDGALKVSDGRIADAGENWLIVNGSNTVGRARYFKVGEIGELEGYTRANAPLADANVPQYVFTAEEGAEGADSISVTTSHAGARAFVEYVAKTLESMGSENVSEVADAEFNGLTYSYYTNVVEPAEETAEDAEGEADAAETAEETAEAPAEETTDAAEGEADAAEGAEEVAEEVAAAEGEADTAEAAETSEDAVEAPAEETADAAEGEADAAETSEDAAEAPKYLATINACVDCAHESCVAVEVHATADSREALPDEAALKALVEQALAAITLELAK